MESRNALLSGMTEAVADLVLRNNQLQTLALSLAQRSATTETGFAARLMQGLEADGRLDRTVEFLPSDAALAERAQGGEGLTRPELAVLLAYAKLSLKDALLGSACRTIPPSPGNWSAPSRRCWSPAIPTRSRAIACAGRSSPRVSPTPSSTAAGRPWSAGSPTRPAPRPPPSPPPTR